MWWSGWRRGWGRGEGADVSHWGDYVSHSKGTGLRQCGERGAKGQNRTADTTIFSRVLYRLSYLGTGDSIQRDRGLGTLGARCVGGAGCDSMWGAWWGIPNAKGQNRTADTTIFSRVLYRLSYLGRVWTVYRGIGVWGWGSRSGGRSEIAPPAETCAESPFPLSPRGAGGDAAGRGGLRARPHQIAEAPHRHFVTPPPAGKVGAGGLTRRSPRGGAIWELELSQAKGDSERRFVRRSGGERFGRGSCGRQSNCVEDQLTGVAVSGSAGRPPSVTP